MEEKDNNVLVGTNMYVPDWVLSLAELKKLSSGKAKCPISKSKRRGHWLWTSPFVLWLYSFPIKIDFDLRESSASAFIYLNVKGES